MLSILIYELEDDDESMATDDDEGGDRRILLGLSKKGIEMEDADEGARQEGNIRSCFCSSL